MKDWIAAAWRYAKRLYQFLLPLRFSFLLLLLVAFAFLISAQGYDIIAHIAEDDPTGAEATNEGQRWGYVLGVIILALQMWYWSRQLLHVKQPDGKPTAAEFPWLTAWMPRLLGIGTFLVGIGSLWRVARHYGVPEPVHQLFKLGVILVITMIAFVIFAIIKQRRNPRDLTVQTEKLSERPLATRIVLGVGVLLSIALFIWATFFVQSMVFIGSAALLFISFAFMIPIGSLLVYFGIRGGVPVLTFLLLWGLIISPFADNHVVKTIDADIADRPAIGPAFEKWFERLDREHPTPDGTHPVVFVATEGGGIRAAYWTAAVLTSLSDTVPTFSDHVFAISGVSGGALGSMVYDALLIRDRDTDPRLLGHQPQMNEQHSLRFAARQMLSQDALTPTLAAMMHPDLLQRFIPVPILPDRARALEGSWERSWRNAISLHNGQDDNSFANGFNALMKGREDRYPSVFLNGTIVETGQRIVASNLHVDRDTGEEALAESVDLFEAIGADVHVSTAVDNSTRFTYVSPAGTLIRGSNGNGGSPMDCDTGQRCEHVVDGGYFENSGSATVADVLEVIARSKYAARVKPHVIFIQFRKAVPTPIEPEKFANEIFSPVRAFLSVRGAHADLATEELMHQMGEMNFTQFELVQTKAVFPLGWLLSDRTRNLMDQQMGPNSKENGANVRRIAVLLGQQVGRDLVQEMAASGERNPRFKP